MKRQDYNGGPNRKVVELFNKDLQAAGMIGSESLYCDFKFGVYVSS